MSKININQKRAFTLAEVLITLGIIGVVAAMTIPTLLNRTNNAELETAFKKSISVVSAAFMLIANDNGGVLSGIYGNHDLDASLDAFCAQAKCQKVCHTTDSQTCGHNTDWQKLDGSAAYQDFSSGTSSAILADGMMITLTEWWQNCTSARYKNIACASYVVDVNGFKKPNKMGRDMFEFFVARDGRVVPQGASGTDLESYINTYCNPATTGGYDGSTCGARIMTEGGMKY